jgi:hypothetical protein
MGLLDEDSCRQLIEQGKEVGQTFTEANPAYIDGNKGWWWGMGWWWGWRWGREELTWGWGWGWGWGWCVCVCVCVEEICNNMV